LNNEASAHAYNPSGERKRFANLTLDKTQKIS